MDSQQLLSKIQRLAGKISDVATQITISESLGFAIPLPTDVDEQTISEVHQGLRKLQWSLEVQAMRGKTYVVLFPLG